MAYITKRGNFYNVRYTYEDEHGKSCDKWESFPTKEEATNRKKQRARTGGRNLAIPAHAEDSYEKADRAKTVH